VKFSAEYGIDTFTGSEPSSLQKRSLVGLTPASTTNSEEQAGQFPTKTFSCRVDACVNTNSEEQAGQFPTKNSSHMVQFQLFRLSFATI